MSRCNYDTAGTTGGMMVVDPQDKALCNSQMEMCIADPSSRDSSMGRVSRRENVGTLFYANG